MTRADMPEMDIIHFFGVPFRRVALPGGGSAWVYSMADSESSKAPTVYISNQDRNVYTGGCTWDVGLYLCEPGSVDCSPFVTIAGMKHRGVRWPLSMRFAKVSNGHREEFSERGLSPGNGLDLDDTLWALSLQPGESRQVRSPDGDFTIERTR